MKPNADNRFVEVGRIGRPHGLEGSVRFTPNDLFTADLFERLSIFYMRNERADLIPARLEEFRISEKNNSQTFFVKFDMIADREAAEAAMNRALFTTRDEIGDIPEQTSENKPDYTGYTVFENGEEIGEVLDVMANPAHPILEVKYVHTTLLIPFVDEYVDRVDDEYSAIHCKNLDHFTD